jgi:hypothetical protein
MMPDAEGQPQHSDVVPVELSPEEHARKLAELQNNQAMMQAAADMPGVPGQRNISESHDARPLAEGGITADDVPKPEDPGETPAV